MDSGDGVEDIPANATYQIGLATMRGTESGWILIPQRGIDPALWLCTYFDGQWSEWRKI